MSNSLLSLLRHGVEVKAVVDVGILNGTPPLMKVFKHSKHYLFEPVEFHFDVIRKNYGEMNYELFNIALSDSDSDAYLLGRSVDGGDTVTHSQVSDVPVTKDDDSRILVCNKIRKAKLDSVVDEITIEIPYLLKIDVDGHELAILDGAVNALKNASIVIIEAPLQKRKLSQFLERLQYMLEQGFVLIDIVDMAYYDDILWQVDLIFVRQDIIDSIEKLKPFESSSFEFDRSLWYPLTKKYFNE